MLGSAVEMNTHKKKKFIREVEGGKSCRTENSLWIRPQMGDTELLPRSGPQDTAPV